MSSALVIMTQDVISRAIKDTFALYGREDEPSPSQDETEMPLLDKNDEFSALQDESEMSLLKEGRRWLERHKIMPNGRDPWLMPEVEEQWWEATDIHTPALLGKLIRGEVIAFADPEVSGAGPVFIPSRLWRQLRFKPRDLSAPIAGGGMTFWNPRFIDAAMVPAEVSEASAFKAPANAEIFRKPGPKPTLLQNAVERIRADIGSGAVQQEELKRNLKTWEARYGVSRDTFVRARDMVLAQIAQDDPAQSATM
ncbi:hypothetical protein [Lichenicoccus roseus]|uniref:Uncharacterized protein n=1 Tax=Lichenicoccus roseus TaxID=2683649 RepID=A0A5R9J6L2_9PROT|nr:hypothetical protein [Lichenicoccus roseus]TLU71261.1 hypothetical protein FE263_17300 [Lichenicoccus roseus]